MALEVLSLLCTFENSLNCIRTSFDSDSFPEQLKGRRFCLFDSETEHRALQFLLIYCSDVRCHSSAPESNKQNPQDRSLDLPIFFRYKNIRSLKNLPSPAPNESFSVLVSGQLCGFVCFEFLLERISVVCIR